MNEVLRSLGDSHTLKIFELIAESRLRAWEIMDIAKITRKQAYSRLAQLNKNGLIKREIGVYRLTTYGMITFELLKIHKKAAEQTYRLVAVDKLLSDGVHEQEMINDLIADKELRLLIKW